MPSMLQGLMGYPAAIAGLVTAPSGLGTMIAMMIVGRLVGRIDVRVLLATGFAITGFSLWQMSHYTLVLSQSDIVWPGLIQGVGLGLVFVPLSAATFATLAPEMRAQGTALYSLVRNIGSSIGIALVQTLLVRNTQAMHAALAEKITIANPSLLDNVATTDAANLLNNEITRQASMIAYVNDFWLMTLLTLAVIPLLLLMRPAPKQAPAAAEAAHAAMD
jgi:DHA2 family multidrug resistance protein